MPKQVNHTQGSPGRLGMTTERRRRTVMLVVLLGLLSLGVMADVVNAIEVPIPTKEQMVYGDFPVVGRRIAIWAHCAVAPDVWRVCGWRAPVYFDY